MDQNKDIKQLFTELGIQPQVRYQEVYVETLLPDLFFKSGGKMFPARAQVSSTSSRGKALEAVLHRLQTEDVFQLKDGEYVQVPRETFSNVAVAPPSPQESSVDIEAILKEQGLVAEPWHWAGKKMMRIEGLYYGVGEERKAVATFAPDNETAMALVRELLQNEKLTRRMPDGVFVDVPNETFKGGVSKQETVQQSSPREMVDLDDLVKSLGMSIDVLYEKQGVRSAAPGFFIRSGGRAYPVNSSGATRAEAMEGLVRQLRDANLFQKKGDSFERVPDSTFENVGVVPPTPEVASVDIKAIAESQGLELSTWQWEGRKMAMVSDLYYGKGEDRKLARAFGDTTEGAMQVLREQLQNEPLAKREVDGSFIDFPNDVFQGVPKTESVERSRPEALVEQAVARESIVVPQVAAPVDSVQQQPVSQIQEATVEAPAVVEPVVTAQADSPRSNTIQGAVFRAESANGSQTRIDSLSVAGGIHISNGGSSIQIGAMSAEAEQAHIVSNTSVSGNAEIRSSVSTGTSARDKFLGSIDAAERQDVIISHGDITANTLEIVGSRVIIR